MIFLPIDSNGCPAGACPSRNFADPMKKAATPRAAKASPARRTSRTRRAQSVGRCWWAGNDPLYIDYHDREWGFPVRDDRRLFEKICPRRLPGRPELAHDPGQAGRFPRRVRQFRIQTCRAVHATRHRAAWSQTRRSFATAARSSRHATTRSAHSSSSMNSGRSPLISGGSSRCASSRPKRLTRDVLAAMPTSGGIELRCRRT